MLSKLADNARRRIDEARSKLTKETYVLLVSCLAGIALGVEAYLTVLSGLLCLSSGFLQSMSSDTDSFATQFALSLHFAEACGAVMSAPFSDNFGRKTTLIYSSAACVLSLLWSVLSRKAADLLTSRTLCGFALGVITATAPVYVAELAPPADRGLLLGSLSVAAAAGGLLACLAFALVADAAAGWRAIMAGPVPALLVLMAGLAVVAPESPRWLLARKTPAECLQALKRLRRGSMGDVSSEFSDVYIALSRDARLGDGWTDIINSRSMSYRLLVTCFLKLAGQVVGLHVVVFFSCGLLGVGAPGLRVRVYILAAAQAAALAGAVAGSRNVDAAGRRQLLFVGCLGMLLALAGVAACPSPFARTSPEPYLSPEPKAYLESIFQKLFLASCLMAYASLHSMGIGQLAWTVAAELFPIRARGKANALSTACHASSYVIIHALLLTAGAPPAVSGRMIGAFGAGVLSIAAVVYLLLPETSGLMLEDMEELFDLDAVAWCCCTPDRRVMGLRRRALRAAPTSLNQASAKNNYSYQASLALPFEPETLHKYSSGMRGVNFHFYGANDDIFPRPQANSNQQPKTGNNGRPAASTASAASALLLPESL